MASIQKHKAKNGTVTFRVQLYINGIRESKSGFESKAEAKLWSVQHEAELLSNPIPATSNRA